MSLEIKEEENNVYKTQYLVFKGDIVIGWINEDKKGEIGITLYHNKINSITTYDKKDD